MADDARARKTDSFGSQTPSSRARQSDTLFDHDSNVLLSPALSATTVNSRPVSGISFLPPAANYRDSLMSIVDDPFFQKLRDVAERSDREESDDEEGDVPFWGHGVEDKSRTDDSRDKHQAPGREPGYTTSNTLAAGTGHREDRDSTSSSARHKRAPPRRESLIIGQSQAANTGLPHSVRLTKPSLSHPASILMSARLPCCFDSP